jgi:hypothetical protein
MKNAAHHHQPSVKNLRNNTDQSAYSIRYVSSPKKSYVVKPKEGEINYNMAYKNFDKFFQKVSTQTVTKFRVYFISYI